MVRRLELLGGAMLRRSWMVVAAFVPVTLLCAWIAAQTLGVNTDTSAMVSEDLPHRVAQREYAAAFPEDGSEIILLVEGGTRDLRELGAERLVEALRARPGLFERVESAASDPFFSRHGLLYLETERLRKLAEGLQDAAPALGALRRDPSVRGMAPLLMAALTAPADRRPEGLEELVREAGQAVRAAREGHVRRVAWRELLMGQGGGERVIVQAAPVFDYEALYPAGPALDAIDEIRAGLDLGDERGVRVRVTGEAALATDELRSASNGAGIATGVAMLGVLVILYLGLRSVRMMLACTITLAVGLLGTAAFAGVAVGRLNLISVAFAVLYIGLGIDYAIHVCLRYREAVAGGWSHGAAALVALRHTGPALVVCALTTSVGFFAFIPTAFEGVSELGLIAGAGMFIGLAVNLLLLPAILVLQGKPRGYRREESSPARWRRVTALPERRRWWFRGLGLGGAAVAAFMAPRVVFDQNRLNLQDPARESVAAFNELMASGDPAPYVLNALADPGEPAERLREELEGLGTVRHARSVQSFVPADQGEKLEILGRLERSVGPALRATPGPTPGVEREVAALESLAAGLVGRSTGDDSLDEAARSLREQILALLEGLGSGSDAERAETLNRVRVGLVGSLEGTLDALGRALAAGPVTVQTLPATIRNHWIATDGRWRVEASPDADLNENEAIWAFARQVLSVAPGAVGEPVSGLEGGRVIVGAFVQAFVTALIAIFVLVLVLLKSVRDAMVVLAPLLLAGGLTGALSVWTSTPFNFANIIALPLMLGVGVDSGIHMVYRARSLHPGESLLSTSTARGVLFSSLTTICSFGSLAISEHLGMASMGTLLTIAITLTLVCTLGLLPALLPKR